MKWKNSTAANVKVRVLAVFYVLHPSLPVQERCELIVLVLKCPLWQKEKENEQWRSLHTLLFILVFVHLSSRNCPGSFPVIFSCFCYFSNKMATCLLFWCRRLRFLVVSVPTNIPIFAHLYTSFVLAMIRDSKFCSANELFYSSQ